MLVINVSLSNNIIFNLIKSQCMIFKSSRFNCTAQLCTNGNIIDYVEKTQYLGYMFTDDKQDDVEMLRPLRLQFLDLPWFCSASGMYANYGIYNLESIIRKQTFGFIVRLCKSCNTIVQTLEMHGLLEYSYDILGLKCCILIDDTLDGNMLL